MAKRKTKTKTKTRDEWLKLAEFHRTNALTAASYLSVEDDLGELLDGPDCEIQGHALDLGNDMWKWQLAIDAIGEIDAKAETKAAA